MQEYEDNVALLDALAAMRIKYREAVDFGSAPAEGLHLQEDGHAAGANPYAASSDQSPTPSPSSSDGKSGRNSRVRDLLHKPLEGDGERTLSKEAERAALLKCDKLLLDAWKSRDTPSYMDDVMHMKMYENADRPAHGATGFLPQLRRQRLATVQLCLQVLGEKVQFYGRALGDALD